MNIQGYIKHAAVQKGGRHQGMRMRRASPGPTFSLQSRLASGEVWWFLRQSVAISTTRFGCHWSKGKDDDTTRCQKKLNREPTRWTKVTASEIKLSRGRNEFLEMELKTFQHELNILSYIDSDIKQFGGQADEITPEGLIGRWFYAALCRSFGRCI